MANYNKVTLIGNLTRDPELRHTPKGTAVCRVGLAINRTWKSEGGEKKEEVTFVDVDTMGKTAENVSQYLKKGRSALFEGRLKLDSWTDKNTQEKRTKLGVFAESVQFLGGKESTSNVQNQPTHSQPARAETPASGTAGSEPEENDDVPF